MPKKNDNNKKEYYHNENFEEEIVNNLPKKHQHKKNDDIVPINYTCPKCNFNIVLDDLKELPICPEGCTYGFGRNKNQPVNMYTDVWMEDRELYGSYKKFQKHMNKTYADTDYNDIEIIDE